MTVCICDPSTREAETGQLQALGQSGPESQTVSQKQAQKSRLVGRE